MWVMKTLIIAGFRNYTRFRNYDSGTTIPRLLRTIQKLAIQKLRLGNYYVRFRNYDWETIVVRFRNYD